MKSARAGQEAALGIVNPFIDIYRKRQELKKHSRGTQLGSRNGSVLSITVKCKPPKKNGNAMFTHQESEVPVHIKANTLKFDINHANWRL